MTDVEYNIEAENAMVDQLIAEHERAEEIAQVALDYEALSRERQDNGLHG